MRPPGPLLDGGGMDAGRLDAGRPDAGASVDDGGREDVDAAACFENPDPGDVSCPEVCPEVCNGKDDDCDGRTDEVPAQASCRLPNARAACASGFCALNACEDGFMSCDGLPQTGCEVDIAGDPANCGGCGNDCGAMLANTAETSCGSSHDCEIVSCADGFASCDGADATGCETSIHTTSDCGGCASSSQNEPCTGLANVTTAECPAGSCQIAACASGWANCDGTVSNGCEHEESVLGPCTHKRMRISIDPSYVDEPLTDFPVLVRMSDAVLSASRADGLDLFFSTDGAVGTATAMPFEIVSWDQAGGALVAWVRVPSVSSSAPTVFYLRYGDGIDLASGNDPQQVWDASYRSVHHFDTGLADATVNGVDGTDQGTTAVAGHIAGARGFPGTAYADMGTGVFPNTASYTLSAWINADLAGGSDCKYVMDTSTTGAPYDGMAFGVQPDSGAVCTYIGGWQTSATDAVSGGTWTLLVVRFDIRSSGGLVESSVNGEPFQTLFMGDTQDAQNLASSPFQVGRWSGNMFYFDGSIDELRVVSAARSDAWVRAEYENQRSGSSFLSAVDE